MRIFNEECVTGAKKHFGDETVDLMVCDPPFGIGEAAFDKHYARKKEPVLDGYVEAPEDYSTFSEEWISEASRILKKDGSMYIISGWNHLNEIERAVRKVGLATINHIIWKYNFGVATQKKYVSSHYHILYLKKPGGNVTFNTFCRFGPQHRTVDDKSCLYQDLEDVWVINKEYSPGETKNKNKLPEALLEKIILYSSNPGDVVCDFFMGNFTTATVARKLDRVPCGFELNPQSFDHHMTALESIQPGVRLLELGEVEVDRPANQGKPLTEEDKHLIFSDYTAMRSLGKLKKDCIAELMSKHGRGKFGIINVLKERENAIPGSDS